MTRQKEPENVIVCPYEKAISLIGNKWSLMILRDLYLQNGPCRFNQLQRSLKGISSKTLSAKLKELAGNGIVEKEIVCVTPVIIQYILTEKGKEFTPILDALAAWSKKWEPGK